MDPERELERMLNEHGAVLIRTGKHLVYKLPNGQKFVRSKTPSDGSREAQNSISTLRHALGIVHVVAGKEKLTMPITPSPATTPAPAAPVPAQPSTPLKDRLDAAVAAEESRQERLLAEAQQVERRIHLLKAILPYVEDTTAEDALRALLPAPAQAQPTAAAPPPPPPPPQVITDRVQITRDLVFAATQTFSESFTINDVVSLMTGGRHLDPPERLRVRACIGQAMSALSERGEVLKEVEHFGRRQAIWRKAELNENRGPLPPAADEEARVQ